MTSFYERFSDKQWQLLEARARRAGQAVQQNDTGHLLDVLIIHLQGERYAISVDSVQGVYEGIAITALPGVPAHIAGIVNIRGQLLTALDLTRILDIDIKRLPDTYVLLVLDLQDTHIAICVEHVDEVTQLPLEDLNPLPSDKTPFVQGVLANGLALLDIKRLATNPALQVNEQL